ncbi:Tex family protein [Natronospora cellulosivora (SeqCode)]
MIKKKVGFRLEKFIKIISKELKLKENQVKGTISLLDEGNTVPFIARYRKEITGTLDEVQIREIEDRIDYLRNLEKRKEEIIRLIDEQDKLTEELEEKIKHANVLQEVEDLYRPYKQKRQTRATKAREKGLEPLADIIWEQNVFSGVLADYAKQYINPELDLESEEDVYQGALDIIAEWISDNAEIRKLIRTYSFNNSLIVSRVKDKDLDEEGKYEIYYDYKEGVLKLPPHRTLAINRGEKEEILHISLLINEDRVYEIIEKMVVKNKENIFANKIRETIEDAYKRLIAPSIEREIRNKLSEKAEDHAIEVFSKNLKALLLQPPLKGQVVMAIDPGFRTGSKVCVVDETGKLLDTETIYPHPPQNELLKSKEKVRTLIKDYEVDSIAIGNGTAARETEFFVADLIKELKVDYQGDLNYIIVNEAGASVYSASPLAREEFPELDVAMRGAVSIARRLQDPLAELVKIEPRSIGVGLYQHDINAKRLEESLAKVVESAVNYVGVDLNTASVSLLKYVSGINSRVAKNIIKYREENGVFKSRIELKKVSRLGAKTYTQAAGFLRIMDGDNPLDNTPIHPESYKQSKVLLEDLGFSVAAIKSKDSVEKVRESLSSINIREKAKELEIGIPTLDDIISALKQPGRDPRDGLSKPIFRTDILKLEDLKEDMLIEGTVRNVVDFGAFVDIGVKEDGLVHISEMSHQYVNNPLDIVEVGDIVTVKVLSVDERRKRIALSMKV